jgi:hypothetical protein
MLARRETGDVAVNLTFWIVACLSVLESPSKGFPERIETDMPSKSPERADDESSPYTVFPLSSRKRRKPLMLMMIII